VRLFVRLSLIDEADRRLGGQRIACAVLWGLSYHSHIVNAGQVFMSFQWDWLLVRGGILAIFLRLASEIARLALPAGDFPAR